MIRPPSDRSDDLAERRDAWSVCRTWLMRASELSAWAMMLCPPIVRRHVPDAERGGRERDDTGSDSTTTRANGASGADSQTERTIRIARWCRSVHRPKADGEQRSAERRSMRPSAPSVVPSAPRASSRYVDTGRASVTATCSRKMPSDGADEPQRWQGTPWPRRTRLEPAVELPATLRRGHVDLHTVWVAELEEPGRVRLPPRRRPRCRGPSSAVTTAAGVLDRHTDVVGAHRARTSIPDRSISGLGCSSE